MSPAAGVAGFLLSLALKVTLLLLLAAAVEHGVLRRRASAATRHLLWSFALGGALLLPLVGGLLPAWRPHPVSLPTPALFRAAPPAAAPAAAPGDAGPGAAPATLASPGTMPARPVGQESPAAAAPASAPVPWAALLLALYAAGALLLLARVAAEHGVVRRLARGATPVRDREWRALLREVAGRAGVRRPVALLRGAGPTMPLTWGVLRPAVLLPADADAWPAARRRAVLIHELAHVARCDCLTQMLAAVACALYWPHPGVWWAARRLRVERELACDDQALARGIGPREYARHLLELARDLRSPRVLTSLAVSMASRSHLELRLLAAIDGARVRTAPGRRATVLGATLTALLLLPLGAVRASAADGRGDPRAGAAPRDGRAWPPDQVGRRGLAAASGVPDATAALPPDGDAREPFEGEWALRMADPQEVEGRAGMVHVALRTPDLNTFYVPVGDLDGLTAEQITRGDAAGARFRLRRDAGTFAFEGSFRGGRGSGRFVFTPDPAFAEALVRRGMERPTPAQQFSLGRHGVPLAFLDELAAQGYAVPTTAALDRAGMSSAKLGYLREMGALGYRLGTLDALVAVADEGVGPRYIRELAALGYQGIAAADLVRLRNEDIDAAFVARANGSAGHRLSVDELLALRMRGGVTAASAPGPNAPSADALATPAPEPSTPAAQTPLAGRWVISGARGASLELELQWDDHTQWKRAFALDELSGVSAGQLGSAAPVPVSFRMEQDAGRFEFEGSVRGGAGSGRFRFLPNPAFAATLRSLGVSGVGGALSEHQAKNLAFGGISAAQVRGFIELGYTSLTLNDVLDLAVRNVTPEYARAMRSLGVTGSNTVPGVIELRFYGITPAYVRELAELGYRGLSVGQVEEMWNSDVTPAFIRRVRESGARRDTSPEELVRMREGERERARRGG